MNLITNTSSSYMRELSQSLHLAFLASDLEYEATSYSSLYENSVSGRYGIPIIEHEKYREFVYQNLSEQDIESIEPYDDNWVSLNPPTF